MIIHPASGLPMGDPESDPFSPGKRPSPREVRDAASSLILSASGWRKIFAPGGDEKSMGADPGRADLGLAALMALVFGEWRLAARGEGSSAPVILGIDTRPTGPALSDAMARVFVSLGLPIRHLFIVAAPEIMAYARSSGADADESKRADSFCYVSASHNPPGHNGVKFGLADGGVLPGDLCSVLIASMKKALSDDEAISRALDLASQAPHKAIAEAYSLSNQWKRLAHSSYLLFTREIVTGTERLSAQEGILERLGLSLQARPLGVVADMNGSARSVSIDRDFLASAGLLVSTINDRPRAFAHRIVPEGESLEPCAEALGKAHLKDAAFKLGYVPDCDGDRGNLVYWDDKESRALPLEAQDVFALSVLSELAYLEWQAGSLGAPREGDQAGRAPRRICVVANDPTSMRIDEIARAFGAECRRAEVGEANVVGLARALRAEGAIARVVGEGSNGGSIIHPSAVRDPLDTVMAVVKLLTLRDEGARPGLFRIWLEKSGRAASYKPEFGLRDVLDSLPAYSTTSVFEERAALKVASNDHSLLKERYEAVFRRDFEARRDELATRYGISAWKAIAYVGQREIEDVARFADSGPGGLKLLFTGDSGKPVAFIWMRGSGTEPVFRILADVKDGLPEDEEYFLSWHAAMVREADARD
jgi:phosphoglucomutase